LNNIFADFNHLLANTFTSIFVHSSTVPDSDKGDNVIFLNFGFASSIFIVTSLDSQIIFSSLSSMYAFKIFSHVANQSTSFSNIQSEFEVVLNSFVLFNFIFT